ncbi:hypothetical protein [Pseudalkalibacillus salsuginis]|uniref:hypothetical protein n=1 Tax=Pseudalkalibacillus salsuginis TaxID=2910972 RepID=UPI001F170046|nr:hypothetical protein [Pseudalkalibacillus salsuginis]MCF6409307.1 hypothetical protein [Pseudalkalibacillus salsuginis]
MEKIKLGQPPHCHKVSFDGKAFKIKGMENVVVPLSETETAQIDVLNEETGNLKLVGKNTILAQLELPLRYCEVGQGWVLNKLSKKKRKSG